MNGRGFGRPCQVAIGALCLLTSMMGAVHAGLPGDVIIVAKAPSLDAALKQVGEFAGQVQPGMNDQMLAMLLGQSLGNPILAGIDRTRPLWIVVLNPQKYGPGACALVPMADKAEFEKTLTKGEPAEGLDTFTLPQGQQLKLAYADSYAVIAKSALVCKSCVELCQSGKLSSDLIPLQPENGAAALTVDVAKVWALYKPIALAGIEQFKMMLNGALQAQAKQTGNNPEQMLRILEAEIGWLVAVLDQSQQLSVALSIGVEGVEFHSELDLREGTPLANWIALQKPGKFDLLKCIPPDVIVGGAMRMDGYDELMDWYLDFIKTMSGDAGPEVMPAIEKTVRDFASVWGGEAAMAMLEPSANAPGLQGVYVLAVKDSEAVKKYLAGMVDMVAAWNKINESLANNAQIEFAANVGTYQGCTIHAYTTRFLLEKIPAQQAEMIRKIFGESIPAELTVTNDRMVIAFGQNSRVRLKEVADLILDGGPSFADSEAIRQVFGEIPRDQSSMGLLVPAGALELVRAFAPIPAHIHYESPAGIGTTSRMSGSKIQHRVVVPTVEVLAIKDAVMAARAGAAPAPQ